MTTNRNFGEYAVAATAFFVSICSLFIYVYQSKIMSEQQQVAVWPFLQWSKSNLEGFALHATNKGVGPAIVRKVQMQYQGKAVASNHALVDAVVGVESKMRWLNSTLEENVLSPGEKILILQVVDPAEAKAFEEKLSAGKFSMTVTYCSIYGRCWTTTGYDAKRAPNDDNIDY